ncbi:MAG TPA: PAS domain S-box protein [Candidatus Binataceae bacterium]|nr:PAS domain S-box protein [Candidatus Binataceae bacterium]
MGSGTAAGRSGAGRVLLDLLPDAALIADRSGTVLAANHKLIELFEAETSEQIVGRKLFALIAPEQMHAAMGAPRSYGSSVHAVLDATTLKGNPLSVEIFDLPLVTDSGQPECILSLARDVSARKRAEREQALLAAIVQSADAAILSITLDFRIASWNAAAEKLFGYTAEEAIGRQPTELVVFAADKERAFTQFAADVEEFLRGKREAHYFEETLRRKDGGPLLVSFIVSGVYDGNAELIGVSVIVRDITEQKRAESARARLATIVEASDDAIIGVTSDFRVATWNRGAQKLLGFTAEEAIGQSCDIFIPSDQLGRAHAMFVSVAEQPDHVLRFEARLRRKGGDEVEASVVAAEVQGAGAEISQSVIMRDITERRRAEREQALLAAIVESSGDAIVSVALDGTITSWNPGAEKLFGFTAGEAVGKPLTIFVPADQQERTARVIEELRTHPGRAISFEAPNLRKDGSRIETAMTVFGTYGRDGRLLGIASIHRDATERRRAERERALLAAIVESSEDAIISIDTELRITSWNKGAQRLFGFTAEEALGRPFTLFVQPERRQYAVEGARRSQRGLVEVTGLEVNCQRKDGSVIEVSITASPVYGPGGEVIGQSAIMHDITERKRAERALIAAQRELRARLNQQGVVARLGQRALEQIDPVKLMEEAAVLLAETLGVERSAIFELQPGGKSLLLRAGYGWEAGAIGQATMDADKQTLVGYTLAAKAPVVVSDFGAETRFHRGRLVGAEGAASALAVVVSFDGEPWGVLVVESRATREFNHDDVNFVQALAHILAEALVRQRAEQELRAARDAALESARAKSAFLAAMSHEIRTPLNSIVGLIGLLLDTPLTAEQRDFMQNILASSDALLSIINNVLDFSRLSAGKVVLEEIEFDPRAVTEGAADMVAETAQRKGLELAVSIDERVPARLRGDPARLRQILINLLGNAVKFTEKGEVVVRVSLESETDTTAHLRFSVTDTGIGISEEMQRILFRPFSQADTSTTRKYGGTGLGLAISSQLAEQMGGKIGVSSRPGQGSTFWFTADFAKTAASETPQSGERELEGLHVLIVDDNATNRWILRHHVESWGMRADAVASGAEALDLVRDRAASDPYAIVLLDYFMPEMDGLELANRIKADPANADVHLVIMSSAGRPREFGARATPIEAWLTKPVKSGQLFKCLTALPPHDGERPRRAPAPATLTPAERASAAVAPAKAAETAAPAGGRILLVEDNPINQKVTLAQLKRLGYEADGASNGREALQAIERTAYDAVLMDCQMPEMDGYEATRELRRREAGKRHTVVIAMTAYGLAGDREKCLAAGMDDYIAKPVRKEQLAQILQRWLAPKPQSAVATPAAPAGAPGADGEALFDVAVLGALRGEGKEFFTELTEMFNAEVPASLGQLAEAFAKGDAGAVATVAYRIKGAAAIFGARRMQEQAAAIEQTARAGSMELAATMMEELRAEFERVRAVLQSECAKPATPTDAAQSN